MTAEYLFREIGGRIRPLLDEHFSGKRDLCILSTRIAIEVSIYFGIAAVPVPTKAIVANRQWDRNMEAGYFANGGALADLKDGSWAVGIGWNAPGTTLPHKWNGHLVAWAGEWFGDFSISNAERPERGLITGAALIGPLPIQDIATGWTASNSHETIVAYKAISDDSFRQSPDWKDEKRRRPIVAALIREIKAAQC